MLDDNSNFMRTGVCFVTSIAWNRPRLASQHRVPVPNAESLDAEMRSLAANTWHVRYISLYQEICSVGTCAEDADAAHKIWLTFDTDHLTQAGVRLS